MKRTPAIVGIVPRKNLWKIIQKEKWYHIPVESSPKNVEFVDYIGFYFPKVFGEKLCFRVIYYAKVKKIEVVKRIELFPEEVNHPRANKDYFKFYLEEIKELPRPIPSLRWRRIVHIPTSYEKLLNAEEINDLYVLASRCVYNFFCQDLSFFIFYFNRIKSNCQIFFRLLSAHYFSCCF
ncbi:MAG: hypothetical protein ACP5OB_06120 [Candidatus Ratteibacteria bacterium]